MPMRNNVTRLLDANRISYQAFTLPADKRSAPATAALLQVPENIVFKTLVVKRSQPGKYVLAVLPGSENLDLKALARSLNEKKLRLATQAEAETITGLQAGGISPLALINRGFQVVVDRQAEEAGQIHISGGQRDLNIRLPADDLIRLTRARVAKITI